MPDWFTIRFWPAMVRVALRAVGAGFEPTEKLIVALPAPPLAPRVSQEALLAAAHAQLDAVVVSCTLPLPPGAD